MQESIKETYLPILNISLFLCISGQEQRDRSSGCGKTDRDKMRGGAGGLHGGD